MKFRTKMHGNGIANLQSVNNNDLSDIPLVVLELFTNTPTNIINASEPAKKSKYQAKTS